MTKITVLTNVREAQREVDLFAAFARTRKQPGHSWPADIVG
jgi:hypothetical protein